MGTVKELGIGKLGQRVTRMLRSNAAYPNTPAQCENTCMIFNVYNDSQKDQSAMLRAERGKGEAIMELQRHRFV